MNIINGVYPNFADTKLESLYLYFLETFFNLNQTLDYH